MTTTNTERCRRHKARAALIAAVAEICVESIQHDAAQESAPVFHVKRRRRVARCTGCGRKQMVCWLRHCKYCGGWMVYDEKA